MGFQSLSFLLFLPSAALLSSAARRHFGLRAGKTALLASSLLFCVVNGGWIALAVLGAGTAVSALAVSHPGRAGRRGAMVYHAAVLLLCKGLGRLPLGISFFTFQQIWLLKESASLSRDTLRDLPLYSFFFPTVSSGPILRPDRFFPQLCEDRFLRPSGEDLALGAVRLCRGMAKKVLLADPLGIVVSRGWEELEIISATEARLVILGYALELYLDFSGYCDIAWSCGRFLGLRLPENFRSPYRACSVGEFWKRWHITLTDFLRECVYFPLGGSRRGTPRTCGNILLVYLLSGFWHGSGTTFLLWGALHGAAQVTERLWGPRRDRLPRALRWLMTFLFVCLAWVFFRAPDTGSALTMLKVALTPTWGLPREGFFYNVLPAETRMLQALFPGYSREIHYLRGAALYALGLSAALFPEKDGAEPFRLSPALGAGLGLLLCWCILSFSGITTFIYSNF